MRSGPIKLGCRQLLVGGLTLVLPLLFGFFPLSHVSAAAGPRANGNKTAVRGERICRRVHFTGEIAQGQESKLALGQGWIFRLVPIGTGNSALQGSVSGWDLAVSPERDLNYPDALLIATPPYASLNQREIGTTFGLRAQDAIAWQPRRFHFLISENDLHRARTLFYVVAATPAEGASGRVAQSEATAELLKIIGDPTRTAVGELAITDAQLTPGIADPPSFARQWAARFSTLPHTLIPGPPDPQGRLHQLRFAVTVWLPEPWRTSKQTESERANCPE